MPKIVEVICYGVGHGDCIYIKMPKPYSISGEYIEILIDTGELSETVNVLSKIEHDKRNLDYIFLTHEHSDHIGGIEKILNTKFLNIKGVHYWMPIELNISTRNISKVRALRRKGVTRHKMIHCEEIDRSVIRRLDHIFGNGIQILYPQSFSRTQYNLSDKNRNSIVIDFLVDDYHFLFMADANTGDEKEILDVCKKKGIDLSKTVMWKIGHHCSKTSTRTSFINTILNNDLLAAVCSCREDWKSGTSSPPPDENKIKKINKKLLDCGLNEIIFTSDFGIKKDIEIKFEISSGGIRIV